MRKPALCCRPVSVRLSVMFVYCIAVYDKDLDLTYTWLLLDLITVWPKVQFCTFICCKKLARLRPETFSQCRTRRTLHVVTAVVCLHFALYRPTIVARSNVTNIFIIIIIIISVLRDKPRWRPMRD